MDSQTLKTIFDLCVPRDDILSGDLKPEIFAARLKDVIDGTADPIYGNANSFFANTYPTERLRTLIRETLGRLTGSDPGKNALIRLETAFGGGKTHGLIALYHLAIGNAPKKKELLQWLGADLSLPKADEVNIAGVVGSDLDPSIGIGHEKEGIFTKTLWGEIAFQLAGAEGYALAKESDELLAAPGTTLFKELRKIDERPALIMIDEVAVALRRSQAYPTKTGKSDLAEQTVAFLMSLIEFAVSQEDVVVVLTLAGEEDAFAAESEMVRQQLQESKAVSARQERVLRPADEAEMPAIVVHRLFQSVDHDGAAAVIRRYHDYYQMLNEKGADIPQKAFRIEFSQEFERSYPFHPELLLTLDKKVSTIPNFHRTRGALRLLAMAVRALWEAKPEDTLAIHPYHLDLSHTGIVEDLTGRLDRPRFKQVVEADIASKLAGSQAHAQEVDRDYPAPYAQRLGTTIFMHSLSQGIATGLSPAELSMAVLTASEGGGDDPAVVQRVLERLYDTAWFLEYDGHRYRFKTEPSLNKIVSDEKVQVGPSKAKAEVERRIRQIWKKGYLQTKYFPDTPADIDDDADLPKLAILHFDAVSIQPDSAKPPELIRRMARHKGTDDSFRRYQNNLMFLVADQDNLDNMVDQNRRYLAIHRILGDADRMAAFNDEQVKKLREMAEAAELEARVAITRAYRYLYYPSSDAPKVHDFLRRETLPPQDQGEVEKDQTNVVLRVLKDLKKVQTADDEMLSSQFVRSKVWGPNQAQMSTEDLRREFFRQPSMRMLLDIGQLKRTIGHGVNQGVWLYYDSGEEFAYDKDSPPKAIEISDEALLYEPEEAERLKLRIKGKWKEPGVAGPDLKTCPVCGNPQDQCTCGQEPEVGKLPAKLLSEGAPSKAFTSIADQCNDHGITRLAGMYATIEGTGASAGNDLRTLALIVPQLGKGVFGMELQLLTAFGDAADEEILELRYSGSWERYKRVRGLVDDFSKEAPSPKVEARLAMRFEPLLEVEGSQYGGYAEIFSALEIDRLRLEAVPAASAEKSE